MLEKYDVKPHKYNMLIARMEPENNIETILDGIELSYNEFPFLVIGKHDINKFGGYLKDKFKDSKKIKFLGGIYNLNDLNNLRFFSNLYFHGHSVGGTNPSLLEAMASKALIIAHDNDFNKSILRDNAFYFRTKTDVKNITETFSKEKYSSYLENNYSEINEKYNWNIINGKCLDFLIDCRSRED